MNIGETEVAAGVGLGLGFLIGRFGGALAAACGGLCVAGGLLFGGCNAFASSFVTLACFDFGAGEGIISWSGRWNKGFLGVLAGGRGWFWVKGEAHSHSAERQSPRRMMH